VLPAATPEPGGFRHDPDVDAYHAIASRRETRRYSDQPIPDDVRRRIIDAGRLSGSSQNTQKWEFIVLNDKEAVSRLVYAPGNVLGAQLVVAIAGDAGAFDVGRAAQNMMLTAWNEGVGSVPNGIRDRAAAETLVGKPVGIVLTFGYPANPRDPQSKSADEWSRSAKRKSFDEVVREI
jgi:nitroreductase